MNAPISRRNFLQAAGALGLGAVIARNSLFSADSPVVPKVETRAYGRSGVQVPVLGLGCMFDTINAQVVSSTITVSAASPVAVTLNGTV